MLRITRQDAPQLFFLGLIALGVTLLAGAVALYSAA
jgi:hypothetical protein